MLAWKDVVYHGWLRRCIFGKSVNTTKMLCQHFYLTGVLPMSTLHSCVISAHISHIPLRAITGQNSPWKWKAHILIDFIILNELNPWCLWTVLLRCVPVFVLPWWWRSCRSLKHNANKASFYVLSAQMPPLLTAASSIWISVLIIWSGFLTAAVVVMSHMDSTYNFSIYRNYRR